LGYRWRWSRKGFPARVEKRLEEKSCIRRMTAAGSDWHGWLQMPHAGAIHPSLSASASLHPSLLSAEVVCWPGGADRSDSSSSFQVGSALQSAASSSSSSETTEMLEAMETTLGKPPRETRETLGELAEAGRVEQRGIAARFTRVRFELFCC